jgi:5'-nucleotidase
VRIVNQFDNAIDLVISGHTHAAYNCSATTVDVTSLTSSTPRPTGIANKVGRLIPVTSTPAFGRVLTEVDVTLDTVTRNVTAVSPNNVLVAQNDPTNAANPDIAAINAHITNNPEVKNVVANYNTAVSPLANAVIANITAPMTNSANAAGEMEAGDLIADAQLLATQPAGVGAAQIAFMNAGGVRSPGFLDNVTPVAYPGDVTYGGAFTVQPFGNSLVTMTLTQQQIKTVLEQQFANCLGQGGSNRIMQISVGSLALIVAAVLFTSIRMPGSKTRATEATALQRSSRKLPPRMPP